MMASKYWDCTKIIELYIHRWLIVPFMNFTSIWKPTANIVFKAKTEYFSPKTGIKAKMLTVTQGCLSYSKYTRSSSQCNKARKRKPEKHTYQKWRNEAVVVEDMIVCIENSKSSKINKNLTCTGVQEG
jgi:hypothetical protein